MFISFKYNVHCPDDINIITHSFKIINKQTFWINNALEIFFISLNVKKKVCWLVLYCIDE